MKATSFVLPVFGALLASAVAFAGSTPLQTEQTKPAAAGQASKDAKPDKTESTNARPTPATQSTKASKKTAASRRAHHGKRHAKKSDAKQSPRK